MVSALLGADSFEFGTAALMMMGCVMAKNCNIKCPAGLTTNPELFDGDPRAMAQYLLNVAHDVREILADLALGDLRAARGRTDLLVGIDHPAIVGRLDTAPLLARVDGEVITDPVYLEADFSVDDSLLTQVRESLFDAGATSVVTTPTILGNRNKSVGAQLAVDIERVLNHTAPDDPASEHIDLAPTVYVDERGRRYLAPDSVTIPTSGSAGLSYGAFCNDGLRLEHTGTCNDGVGKSMSGGAVVVRSPGGGSPAEGGNVLVGNFALFGAPVDACSSKVKPETASPYAIRVPPQWSRASASSVSNSMSWYPRTRARMSARARCAVRCASRTCRNSRSPML